MHKMKMNKYKDQKRKLTSYLKQKKRLRRSSSTSSSASASSSSSESSFSSSSSFTSSCSSTSDSTISTSSSSDSPDKEEKDKKRIGNKKLNLSKRKRKHLKEKKSTKEEDVSTDVPLNLMDTSKVIAPMTKQQWDKQQSIIRKVYDENTGRHRLIKGDGEVVEEIVSKEKHKNINKTATKGDGEYFQRNVCSGSNK
ncbi:hypothetical protein FQA39_LY10837 [Lamprigera yunnana]|nr:hypothetical protein FQA39_LY10837 [Lamprigera yunnana]